MQRIPQAWQKCESGEPAAVVVTVVLVVALVVVVVVVVGTVAAVVVVVGSVVAVVVVTARTNLYDVTLLAFLTFSHDVLKWLQNEKT